ncbi:MAG: T9SS type A sorting domain-containing protein, partial [Ignavibacteriaceae bacterium]
ISSIAVRGDSLYAATVGEGVLVLNLLNPTAWQNFRNGLPFGVSWNVYSIYNFNSTLICGAGGNAKVYFNTNGSDNWVEKSFDLPAAEPKAMISITSYGDTIIGVSYFGIYRSQNSGASWEYYDPGIGLISFASVTVVNDVIFAIISKLPRSYFISSINAGVSWEFEFEFNTMAFSILYYNGKLFTGRSNGLYWLPYTPTNIDDDIITNDFILYQNYPNPFNPSTIIKYSIPGVETRHASSLLQLKVYDVLGNEIATLVNEYKPAGSYEVEFSGEGLSSGIYFYRLAAGEFTETKKMLMLK